MAKGSGIKVRRTRTNEKGDENKKMKWTTHFRPDQVKSIWKRDGGICIYCGSPAQQIDHVVPVAKGGKSIKSNGVCVCRKCNYKKRDKLDQEFLTRGIFWLLQQGENLDWLDNLD